jgi:MarR family transcriptional regulator, organic hydroperoxide resistance regulator
MSTGNRLALHAELVGQIRSFIAGAILFNQKVADHVGLHLTDMQCVNLLDLLGPVTPGRLAECTGLSTGGVTVMLDRLEKAGVVKRERNPNDRRSVLVRVNPKKLRKINAFYKGINKRLESFFSETPEAELRQVADFLSRMNAIRTELRLELE